jgi:hypothetical protein
MFAQSVKYQATGWMIGILFPARAAFFLFAATSMQVLGITPFPSIMHQDKALKV